jgi:hypothetical protein
MLSASWLSQREQFRVQALVHEAVKRETLYAEFIIEASKRFTEAWTRHAESPKVLAGLYSALERIRLTSSIEVIRVAEQVREVIEGYPTPTGHSMRCGSAYEAMTGAIR